MSMQEKIVAYVENERAPEPVDCYAVPGNDSIIDVIHPLTGLTVYCKETQEQIQLRNPDAVRMTIEEFCQQKAERQHAPVSWYPVTEEIYNEMLECLPPAYYGKEGFLVGEPADHDASNGRPRYHAFVKWEKDTYRQSSRPLTIKEYKEFAVIGEPWM